MPMLVVTGADSFIPSGMNKNGVQALTGSFAEIPGWTADTAGFPGSSLVGNGLRNQGNRAPVTVTATLAFSGGGSSTNTQQARIMVNTGLAATGQSVTGVSGTLVAQATIPLADGDVVTVQAICNSQLAPWVSSVQATGTTVRIT